MFALPDRFFANFKVKISGGDHIDHIGNFDQFILVGKSFELKFLADFRSGLVIRIAETNNLYIIDFHPVIKVKLSQVANTKYPDLKHSSKIVNGIVNSKWGIGSGE